MLARDAKCLEDKNDNWTDQLEDCSSEIWQNICTADVPDSDELTFRQTSEKNIQMFLLLQMNIILSTTLQSISIS